VAFRTTGSASPATGYAFIDCSLLVKLILIGVGFTNVHVFVVANVESVIVVVVVALAGSVDVPHSYTHIQNLRAMRSTGWRKDSALYRRSIALEPSWVLTRQQSDEEPEVINSWVSCQVCQ
ncbi:hypothetical protein GQ607_004714, partial [Colletotrichum asianum]